MDVTIIDMEKGRTSGDGMEEEIPSKVEQSNGTKKHTTLITTRTTASLIATSNFVPNKEKYTTENSYIKKTSTISNSSNKTISNNQALPLPGLHTLYRRTETKTRSIAPVMPKGDLIQMTPRLVSPYQSLPEHKKTKAPKFVPYEPYPGAVNPIEPNMSSGNVQSSLKLMKNKVNKNNLDIKILVQQMSTMRAQELNEDLVDKTQKDEKQQKKQHLASDCVIDQKELQKLKDELKKLKEERDYYQGQFKFQTQVNAELKSLLVASVGEDLQTRVNLLTEDKLQLARALLDTANNLTTHTEQIEFLAGQCEVWRSKFLASSVMIEELARWKADLTQKNQLLHESTTRLLSVMHQLRDMQLDMLRNLKFIAKIRYLNLPASDVMSLSAENANILQQMVLLHSSVGMPDANLNISCASTNPLCETEKFAVQALDFLSQPLMATDEAICALFEQAQRPYGGTPSRFLDKKCLIKTTENNN